MRKFEYFALGNSEVSTAEIGMRVIASMPYLELVNFAGLIEADVDKIANAAERFFNERAELEQEND